MRRRIGVDAAASIGNRGMIVTTPDNPSPATTGDQLAKVAALTATAIAGLASAGTASGGLSKLYRNHPV
jgi:hypothetical protein